MQRETSRLTRSFESIAAAAAISKRPIDRALVEKAIVLPVTSLPPQESMVPSGKGESALLEKRKPLSTKETTNASLLAFMHDLVAQSPMSACALVNEQLYDLEKRFRERDLALDEQQVREFQRTNGYVLYRNVASSESMPPRARPFNFQPFGTNELFLNWPAGRDCVKKYRVGQSSMTYEVCVPQDHGKWLEQKLSVNRVPFSLDWYDPQLYFSRFAAPARLLRRHLEMQLRERRWSNERLSALIADSTLSAHCKPSYSPQQCLLSWLQAMYANAPRGDDETLLLHQQLFSTEGKGLLTKAQVASLLVFALLERVASGKIVGSDQKKELSDAQRFISAVGTVQNAIVNVPPVEKSTAIQYALHTALDSEHTRIDFLRRLFSDLASLAADTAVPKRFLAAEVARWNAYFFSGWNAKMLDLPIETFEGLVDRLYQCLSTHSLVIDADALRRFTALNLKALLDSKVEFQPCTRSPSLNEYSQLFLRAERAAKGHVKKADTGKDVENKDEKEDVVVGKQEGEEGDVFESAEKRYRNSKENDNQRIILAIRDIILAQKHREHHEWLDDLYRVLVLTFDEDDAEKSWLLLRSLLKQRLPSVADVPLKQWAPWQIHVLRLYNGDEVLPPDTVDLPLAFLSRRQFAQTDLTESKSD